MHGLRDGPHGAQPGAAALSAAALPVIFSFKQIAERGIGWVPTVPVVAGLTVGAAFVRRQGFSARILRTPRRNPVPVCHRLPDCANE